MNPRSNATLFILLGWVFCQSAQAHDTISLIEYPPDTSPTVSLIKEPLVSLDITEYAKWTYDSHNRGNCIILDSNIRFQPIDETQKYIPAWDWVYSKPIWCVFKIGNHSKDTMRLLLNFSQDLPSPKIHSGDQLLHLLFRQEPKFCYLFEVKDKNAVLLHRGGKFQNARRAGYSLDKSYLPFSLNPGETKVLFIKLLDFLPFKSSRLYIHTVGWERSSHAAAVQKLLPLYPYYSLICGLLFFMSFTGLARYFFFSDRSFLYYGFYVGLNGLYFLIRMDSIPYVQGPIYYYFPWIAHHLGFILVLSYAFYIRFCIHFLRMNQMNKGLYNLFQYMYTFSITLSGLILIVILLINNTHIQFFVNYGALVIMMIIGLIGILNIYKMNSILARIIVTGTIFYYVGSILGFLESLRIVTISSDSILLQNPLLPTTLGCMIEAIMFFVGLGYRQKLLQDEKTAVESQYLKQVETNLQILQTAQQEKEQIAHDLHDEIGSTLSSISILGEATLQNQQSKLNDKRLATISTRAREVMDIMSDIVWSVNPKNDEFGSILLRMREFAIETLEAKDVLVHFTSDAMLENLKLPMEQRKDLYLIFKEAINNAAKYAEAQNVWIHLKKEEKAIHLEIRDDGKGFDLATVKAGNGLRNMQARTERLGGILKIESKIMKGTKLTLSFPIA